MQNTKGKQSIGKIREEIQALNWARQYFTGGTREENKRTRLDEILAPHVAAVEALQIPARFAKDIEARAWALECAAKVLARWQESQSIALFVLPEAA